MITSPGDDKLDEEIFNRIVQQFDEQIYYDNLLQELAKAFWPLVLLIVLCTFVIGDSLLHYLKANVFLPILYTLFAFFIITAICFAICQYRETNDDSIKVRLVSKDQYKSAWNFIKNKVNTPAGLIGSLITILTGAAIVYGLISNWITE